MKNVFKNAYNSIIKLFATRKAIAISAVLSVLVVGGSIFGLSSCSQNQKPTATASKEVVSTEDETIIENTTTPEADTSSEVVSESDTVSEPSKEPGKESGKKDSSSKKATTSKKQETTSSKKNNSNTSSKKPSTSPAQKDYLDTSKLTYTKEDVGKVVGYDSSLSKDVKVVSVIEKTNGSGLKYVEITYSNMTTTSIGECAYCHKTPCPNGGGQKCSKYNIKEDTSKTCSKCNRPYGDGYNGTCYSTIDWNNGGKTTCHHFD